LSDCTELRSTLLLLGKCTFTSVIEKKLKKEEENINGKREKTTEINPKKTPHGVLP
jgi:hypothetical protein